MPLNKIAIAYVDIGCSITSIIGCLLVCILGMISPIYRKYPSKIIVWISILFIFLCIFIIVDQTIVILHNYSQDKTEFDQAQHVSQYLLCMFIIIISSTFILYIDQMRICIYDPFQANISFLVFAILSIQVIIIGCMIVMPYFNYNQLLEVLKRTASIINSYSFVVCVSFFMLILVILKQNKKLQSRAIYNFKYNFIFSNSKWLLTILIIFFLFSQLDIYYIHNQPEILKVFLSLAGLLFSLFQLFQPYCYLRLKTIFIKSQEDISLIKQIEEGLEFDMQNKYVPNYEKLFKAQVNELVKGLVKAVHSTLIQQFKSPLVELEQKRIYTFKFHLYDDDSRISYIDEQDAIKDSIILVKAYYPNFFTHLLKNNGYNQKTLDFTLDLQYNLRAFEKAKQSLGRSGAFFFTSQNNKLILKTISKSDVKGFIKENAIKYFDYIQNNPHTALAKFYGVYKVKLLAYKTQYVLLMENTLEQLQGFETDIITYDLKGSKINRFSKSSTLKDLNFLSSPFYPITLPQEISQNIKEQIKNDSTFLKDLGYMDYSLLLGIGQSQNKINEKHEIRLFQNPTYDQIYSISIIDYLQQFDSSKKREQWAKQYILCKQKEDLSCRSPQPYFERFIQFMNTIFV